MQFFSPKPVKHPTPAPSATTANSPTPTTSAAPEQKLEPKAEKLPPETLRKVSTDLYTTEWTTRSGIPNQVLLNRYGDGSSQKAPIRLIPFLKDSPLPLQ